MSKKCAKCEKTVYPTEELKCLDKIWHKGCFKCQVCNMTLNMKNYKGYDKMPYCNAHYPTTKHTQVADTPEMKRIAENTAIQSNVKYHQEFERQKGKKISVEDDPETARVKQHMKTVSNVAYHGTLEQKQHMEEHRPQQAADQQQYRRNPGKISEYDPPVQSGGTPYSQRTSQTNVVYDSEIGKVESAGSGRRVGSIADYDPMNDRYGSIAGQAPQSYNPPPQQYQQQRPQQYQPPPPQQYQPPPQQYQPPPPQQQQYSPPQPPVDRRSGGGMVCKAMYDYTAADDDEVSFMDGDTIILCQPVDAGWMEGTVQRTGQRGMLPSNYVEQIK